MLKDDVMAATKRMVASASGGQSNGGGKGKESKWDEDTEHKCHDGVQIHALRTCGKAIQNLRHSNNPKLDNDSEQVRFIISSSITSSNHPVASKFHVAAPASQWP